MTNVLSPTPRQKFFTNAGAPAVGYKLFTYAAGTTTKIPSYQNQLLVSPNANPVVLDFRGECNLWVAPNVAYKYVLALPSDTDPPTNPIWTVDNIIDSQLITLYGGVDTGVANAYVLNFTANFTAYTDGIVIYWLPAHTNTGPSTINVNGLGPVAILNQDGQVLSTGQIAANTFSQIIYQGTGFKLLTPQQQVFFAGTSTGTADNYALTVALFTTRAGSIVYFAPNIANTGADVILTINGNSGAIRNVDGSILQARQLQANVIVGVILNTSGFFTLVSSPAATGSFTGVLTGLTAPLNVPVLYSIVNGIATLRLPASGGISGVSNSNAMTMTGLPAVIAPIHDRAVYTLCRDVNLQLGAWAIIPLGGGTITFAPLGAGFTAAGQKGLSSGWCMVYPL